MIKRYTTTLSNGHVMESNNAYEAHNFPNYDHAQTFALAGRPVTAFEFYAAVSEAVDAAWSKKEETHKRVSVQYGATHLGRVEKWVRK